MNEEPVRNRPLASVTPLTADSTRIAPWQPGGMLNLRGPAQQSGFTDAVAQIAGTPLAVVPNTFTRTGPLTLLWLGPDEWLLVADPDNAAPREALAEALHGQRAAITAADCSYAGIELTGPDATALLARGTPVDLHPSRFAPGSCAQTRLAKATVILWRTDEALRMLVRRSMAGYLWRWLEVVSERVERATIAAR
ncbi:sarcosine oxidase subunit gamma [Arhodomonas sp. AD133]|uniref:sarcosine oxidase subunit gamma n=1 Tax=Arhodomonas sp. AD133 TaxID=3415009 RepID=UPI003EBBE7C0